MEWEKQIQEMVDLMDACIKNNNDEGLTLSVLAQKFGYSEYYMFRKFSEISGMRLRDYLRYRRLAFALKELRDTDTGILDIAVKYGFSSHEAFSPHLRRLTASDRVRTVNGQLMAWINEPAGRICSWGIPLAEAYGVRLPADYNGSVPEQMLLMDVPEGEYIVFEHGSFDIETESQSVEQKMEAAMKNFDYEASGYRLDLTPERVFYLYYDSERFFKYVRPVYKQGKK